MERIKALCYGRAFFSVQCFELLIFDLYDKITMSTMSLMCLVRVVELAIKYK